MKEIVVISGKGGTGKTSITASFAFLASKSVLADCDVDAANLYLVLNPEIKTSQDFMGGKLAKIDPDLCTGCGICDDLCRYNAISYQKRQDEPNSMVYKINPIACEGCGVCPYFCPELAIEFNQHKNGELFLSDTRFGPMVHAKLGIAEENSGKLVSQIRQHAKEIAKKDGLDYIISDGPPGIGCPVISSITGADIVLIVTEPTIAGLSDLQRVNKLAKHFNIPATVCINKWDINPSVSKEISDYCSEQKIKILGNIRYDNAFTAAQIKGITIPEYTTGSLTDEIKLMWDNLIGELALI
ncbi:MAG: ATP-binding protein [candidate division Zixibacteria bacterium]|nr:ATP-binding protein [candidate division Zixibacteria bacterium]